MFEIHLDRMKAKFSAVFFGFLIFSLTSPVLAQVKINEVNWMGVAGNSYAEWVELYNDGNSEMDLKDAVLYEDNGAVQIIKLTKKILPGGHYLIERVTPSSGDPVPGTNDDSGSFGGGGLSNSGEFLVLKDSSGTILDLLDASKGWPAGDSKTYKTMQWDSTKWITATATPRALNEIASVEPNNDDTSTDATPTPSTDQDSPKVLSGSSISAHESPIEISEKVPTSKILVSAGRDRLVAVGAKVPFEAVLTNGKGESMDPNGVSWSFGDGSSVFGKKVEHTYRFPGTYAVVMSASNNGSDFISRANITVVLPELDFACNYSLGTVCTFEIENFSKYELNLGGWMIENSLSRFVFPKDTIILSKKKILLPKGLIGMGPVPDRNIFLKNPSGETVAKLKLEDKAISEVKLNIPVIDVSPTIPTVFSTSTMLEKLSVAEKALKNISQKSSNDSFVHSVVRANLAVAVLPQEKEVSKTIEIIEKPKSIIGSIIHLPVSAFDYLKNIFF